MRKYAKAIPGEGIVATRILSSEVDNINIQQYSDNLAVRFSEWVKKQPGVEDCGGDFNEYRNYIEFVIIYDDGYANDTFGIDCNELTGHIGADLRMMRNKFHEIGY